MMSGWGGARPGAGRKPKSERYASAINAIEDRIASGMPARVATLELLAEGRWEQIEEEWQPAGMVFVGSVRAFPHKPADELVLVRRKRSIAAPDRQANTYLLDRILGRPTATVEGDLNIGDPDAIVSRFEDAIARVYGRIETDAPELDVETSA